MTPWSMAAILVLVSVCGVNIVAMVRRVPPPARVPETMPSNVVIRHEQRMAGLRRALQTRGVDRHLGYLADVVAESPAAGGRSLAFALYNLRLE